MSVGLYVCQFISGGVCVYVTVHATCMSDCQPVNLAVCRYIDGCVCVCVSACLSLFVCVSACCLSALVSVSIHLAFAIRDQRIFRTP